MLDLDRVFQYLASCRWFRHVRANGWLNSGGYDEYLETTRHGQMLELRFDTNQGRFLGQPAGSDTTSTIPGSDKNRSDGELEHLLAFPEYQLVLPFPQEAWCQLE
jgi:hypothetical protein